MPDVGERGVRLRLLRAAPMPQATSLVDSPGVPRRRLACHSGGGLVLDYVPKTDSVSRRSTPA